MPGLGCCCRARTRRTRVLNPVSPPGGTPTRSGRCFGTRVRTRRFPGAGGTGCANQKTGGTKCANESATRSAAIGKTLPGSNLNCLTRLTRFKRSTFALEDAKPGPCCLQSGPVCLAGWLGFGVPNSKLTRLTFLAAFICCGPLPLEVPRLALAACNPALDAWLAGAWPPKFQADPLHFLVALTLCWATAFVYSKPRACTSWPGLGCCCCVRARRRRVLNPVSPPGFTVNHYRRCFGTPPHVCGIEQGVCYACASCTRAAHALGEVDHHRLR